jgi:hypothetical protein
MALNKNDVRLISLKSLVIHTALGYEHELNLVPYGWNVTSHQAVTKDFDQVMDKNPPSLSQQGREYPIHSWTFVWCKRINCPFLYPISDNPPVQTFGPVSSVRACQLLSNHQVRKVNNKEEL